MSYISRSTDNITWNRALTPINRINVWILSIRRKYSTIFQQVLGAIKIQQLTGKYNRVHVNTSHIYKNIVRKNIQENRSILNQIRHMKEIGNKIISFSANPQHQIILVM